MSISIRQHRPSDAAVITAQFKSEYRFKPKYSNLAGHDNMYEVYTCPTVLSEMSHYLNHQFIALAYGRNDSGAV